jgi:hypothetical protein
VSRPHRGGRWSWTAVLLLWGAPALAGEKVELAPFGGLGFGGSFYSTSGRQAYIGAALAYGATLNLAIADNWRVEALYSRQPTDVTQGGGPGFDLTVERYMFGIVEEKGEEPTRFFGSFLLGATRFNPGFGGYHSDVRFTGALTLGLKQYFSRRIGFRAEARGFFVVVESGAGALCSNGACIFAYSGSGLWQGDVTAGITIGF